MENLGNNTEVNNETPTRQEAPTTEATKNEAQLKTEIEKWGLRREIIDKELKRKRVVEPITNPNAIKPDDLNIMPLGEVKDEINKQRLMWPEIPEVVRKIPETERKNNEVIIKEDGTKIIKRKDGTTVTIKWAIHPA